MSIPKHRLTEQTSLVDLIAIIEQSHHIFTRTEMSRIAAMLDDEELATLSFSHEIRDCFEQLRKDMEMHLLKEEHILFPYIADLERNPALSQYSRFGSIRHPIRKMRLEHIAVYGLLEKLRELTMQYCPTPGSHPKVFLLYAALAGLDGNLIQHMHLEDRVLFPRALQLGRQS
ncbi:Iron-sulfur cluster repair protein YtfE [Methylophilaceae bacterium]|nr:Iron-sulfur cluster repair protein YtfE [Methylophilaceae bacterium]